jgi:hypothetical protein
MNKCESPTSDIRASRLIGRVGGLAVALGVGAVWFSGGVAWADTGSDSGTSGRTSQARNADNDSPRSATANRSPRANRNAPGAAAATAKRGPGPAAVASKPSRTAAAAAAASEPEPVEAAIAVDPTPAAPAAEAVSVAAEPAESTPTVQMPVPTAAPVVESAPEVAPVSAEVSAFATAGTDTVDPTVDDNPIAPADNPLEWAVAAFARRSAVPAAALDPTYSQGLCTQQSSSCTYIMGASGTPIPSQVYADTVMKFYVLPNTTQQDTTAQIIFTPEGAYPVTGIKVLPLTISAVQGQTELEDAINYFQPGPQTGSVPLTIFGYSQSAVISSLLQRDLDSELGLLPGLDRDLLTFVTVGQEMSPDGGWFARYPGLNLPSLGEYFFGSTPEDSYPTTNYTLEYDGFADSPRYPGNFLSSLNAALGILLVHTNYANENYFKNTYGLGFDSFDGVMGEFGPGIACNQGSSSCIELPTTSPTQKYYFIKTPHLPLLAPVRAIPFIGKPIAALIEPALKVIVDLGYGDQAHGFTSAPQPYANVPAPFGLFPQVSPIEVVTKLVSGVQQGFTDFFAELRSGGGGGGGINLPSLNQILSFAKAWVTELPARVNMAGSALYATLLATADFANATLTALPGYNIQVAVDSIKKVFTGELNLIEGLISAIGLPWASTVGLASVIGVVQTVVWLEGILAAITGCGPAAPQANMCLVPSLA